MENVPAIHPALKKNAGKLPQMGTDQGAFQALVRDSTEGSSSSSASWKRRQPANPVLDTATPLKGATYSA